MVEYWQDLHRLEDMDALEDNQQQLLDMFHPNTLLETEPNR
jgi:hypothetical protein